MAYYDKTIRPGASTPEVIAKSAGQNKYEVNNLVFNNPDTTDTTHGYAVMPDAITAPTVWERGPLKVLPAKDDVEYTVDDSGHGIVLQDGQALWVIVGNALATVTIYRA